MTPLINIDTNAVLTSSGLLGLSFIVNSPEPYSLSKNNLEKHFFEITRALNLLGENIIFHRLDFFNKKLVNGEDYFFYDDFLNKIEKTYFDGRESYTSLSVISFFISDLETLTKDYLANPFKVKKQLLEEEKERISLFERNVNNAVSMLNSLNGVDVYPIEEEELRAFMYSHINGFNSNDNIHSAKFGDTTKIGDNYFRIFSFSSTSHFAKSHEVIENDTTIPNSPFVFRGLFDELGVHFHFNHVLNQIIKIPSQEVSKSVIELRKTTYNSWKGYKTSIEDGYTILKDFEKSVDDEDNKICHVHNNIMLFDSDLKRLDKAVKKINEIFSNKKLFPLDARYEFAENIYNSSIIGRVNELKEDFYYMSSLKDSSALAPVYGSFKDDDTGFVFQDRIHNKPLIVDLFDVNRKHIAAKNGMIITSTGEGKSSTLLNICYQALLSNVKLICVEFGQSFGFITKLYKDRAAHIKLESNTPMGINPFNLNGKACDSVKVNLVTGFLLKCWRKNVELLNEQGVFFVSLQSVVSNYYKNISEGHSIDSFYTYVVENWKAIQEAEGLEDEFLKLSEFKLFIRQFIKGGLYDFVCAENPEMNRQLIDSDIVVYELTEVKKDPFLLSIVLAALLETINVNILSDRSKLGGILMDEFAETAQIKDVLGSGDILSATAWIYQKIRKENGFIWTVVQSIAQLPKSEFVDNIITNVQLVMTLGLTELVAEDVIRRFKIKNEDHINLMKSARKQFDTFPKWSELFVRFGDSRCMVVRQEFPIEKFLAFQTDGDLWSWMSEDYKQTNDMQKTIDNTIKYKGYEKNTYNKSAFIGY